MESEEAILEWDVSPILIPLAYEKREWNAVNIAFYMAEYCGAPVVSIHVKTGMENENANKQFIDELKAFASELKVDLETVEIGARKGEAVKITEISDAIVKMAVERRCQAVIMSAHREPFFRELFGRVSDHVARKTPCRVALVESPWAGLTIPKRPTKILIPIFEERLDPEPLVMAAALTSSATAPHVELQAARIIELPQTIPLEAVYDASSLKREEREFSLRISSYIRFLGRLFTPFIYPVRNPGEEISTYSREEGIDLILMSGKRPSKFMGLLTRSKYDVVRKAPCISIVTFPPMKKRR